MNCQQLGKRAKAGSSQSFLENKIYKDNELESTISMAWVEGLEPPVAVLETAGLPLTDTHKLLADLYQIIL